MNTLELKNILISEIAKIDDDSFLSAKQYNEEIKVAEQEIENGNFYSHSEIKGKIEQWKKE